MIKFAMGFATCWYVGKYNTQIREWLQEKIAMLELKRDILEHDNPDIKA